MLNGLRKGLDKIKAKQRLIDSYWDESSSDDVIGFYTRVVTSLSAAELCSVFIYNPETDTLWKKAGTDVNAPRIEVSKESSMVGKVLASGEPLFENDLESKEGAHKSIDSETGFVTRNALCVPILSLDGKNVTGVIQVLNKSDGTSFNDDDLKLLEEVARYMALSIENIFLGQESLDITEEIFNAARKLFFGLLGAISLLLVLLFAYLISLKVFFT